VIQSCSSIGTGIIIAFIYSWEFALFIIGIAPFFFLAGFVEMKIMTGLSGSEALEGAGQVTILSLLGMWRPRTLEVCARAGPSKGRVGLGLEIHLVRRLLGWAGPGTK